jgi:heptosyltransferase-3
MRSFVKQPNIVIFRIGSIGDSVVCLPCLHAIARAYPGHRRILLTNVPDSARAASAHSVLEGSGLIHQTLHFPLGLAKLGHTLALARCLRRLEPQALVYLAPRPTTLPVLRDILFFKAAGVRRVIGAPLDANKRRLRVDPATGELEFEAQRLARLLGDWIPVDLSRSNWSMCLSAAELATAAAHLAQLPPDLPLIGLSPGAKVAAKDWGEANWTALVERLNASALRLALVFFGAPDERALTERLASRWSGQHINLSGSLSPRESAAVLARCTALVCHDSGPMHLAASQGTACIALFGHYNKPRQWFPYGEGHRVLHEPRGIERIEVRTVVDALQDILQGRTDIAAAGCSPGEAAGTELAVAELAIQRG